MVRPSSTNRRYRGSPAELWIVTKDSLDRSICRAAKPGTWPSAISRLRRQSNLNELACGSSDPTKGNDEKSHGSQTSERAFSDAAPLFFRRHVCLGIHRSLGGGYLRSDYR